MLPMLILGMILAVVLVLMLRTLATAPTRLLLRVLGWTLGILMLGVFAFLVVTSRLSWALGALIALAPWLILIARSVARGRRAARMFQSVAGGAGLGAGLAPDPDPNDRSDVTTRFLAMTLSHATGAMTGTVREGSFAGRALDDLTREEGLALWREVQTDPESARVLDAWLERVHPDWRATDGARDDASGESIGAGPMTRAEALDALGLDEGADAEAVKAAHRRLIVLVHPDRGGTPYLAARLNQARDILLGRKTGHGAPG